MSAQQLLEQARALGIVLFGASGRLRYEAPVGRLTPELRRALSAHRAAILDLLEAESLSARRMVHCSDCANHLPSPPIRISKDITFDTPGGCVEARKSPDSKPLIYPCTGWYCDGWAPRRLQ